MVGGRRRHEHTGRPDGGQAGQSAGELVERGPVLHAVDAPLHDADDVAICLSIEYLIGRPEGEPVSWTTTKSIDVVFADVARELQRLGIYPGDRIFDATQMMRHFARTLAVPSRARAGAGGAPSDIGPIIELVGDQSVGD